MNRSTFTVVLITGMLAGLTGSVYAEPIEGVILSIDSKKNQLSILPSGSTHPRAGVSVSVLDFVRKNGLAQLNDLDVGKTVSMNIEKDPSGKWEMTSLKEPELLVPAPEQDSLFLKTEGEPEQTPHPRDFIKKFSDTKKN